VSCMVREKRKGGLMRSRTVTNAVTGVALTNLSHTDRPFMRG
jgi:hypothetical protein